MIYTVTFNPSIDLKMELPGFCEGAVNRSVREWLCAGGKGINVSCVLARLGIASKALAPVAGFVGGKIEELAREMGIVCDFSHFDEGCSRINVKLCGSTETEINAKGPDFAAEFEKQISEKLASAGSGDYVVLSGSAPDSGAYARLAACTGARTVIDAEGALLKNSLASKPFLVKPNLDELSGLFGEKIADIPAAMAAAERLCALGAQNVIVSMGGQGAILVNSGGTVFCPAAQGRVVNTTGAGDSLVAGFLAGLVSGLAEGDALRLGAAAGSATAFSENLAEKEDILALYNNAENRIK